jgi:hypothetical protein
MVQGSILEAISVFILYEQEFILFSRAFFDNKHVDDCRYFAILTFFIEGGILHYNMLGCAA